MKAVGDLLGEADQIRIFEIGSAFSVKTGTSLRNPLLRYKKRNGVETTLEPMAHNCRAVYSVTQLACNKPRFTAPVTMIGWWSQFSAMMTDQAFCILHEEHQHQCICTEQSGPVAPKLSDSVAAGRSRRTSNRHRSGLHLVKSTAPWILHPRSMALILLLIRD